ncbi:type II toxin-antitoxin system RatA family toxin [bacterium]|nr:type II toxin-antitoxin system RatA family toxin [bacterium]
MTSFRRSVEAPYGATDLFDLVSDVRRYPEFVRWVHSLRVLKEETELGRWRGRAEARVGFKGFSEAFTTDVEACRDDLDIKVSLVRGPLRRLTNRWRFAPSDAGSVIHFEVDFEFRNPILQALARANFDLAVDRLVQSFLDEAGRRYPRIDPLRASV